MPISISVTTADPIGTVYKSLKKAADVDLRLAKVGDNTDVATWSEHQAALLRRAGAGKNVYDQIDWESIAGENKHLDKAPGRELASRIATVLVQLMKIEAAAPNELRAGSEDTIRGPTLSDVVSRDNSDTASLRPRMASPVKRHALRQVVRPIVQHSAAQKVTMASLPTTAANSFDGCSGCWRVFGLLPVFGFSTTVDFEVRLVFEGLVTGSLHFTLRPAS